MKAGVVIFPGSNCDRDCLHAIEQVLGWDAAPCWHRDPLPGDLDFLVLPGGFSHGDHLRCGAIAALAPVMDDVRAFAASGKPVLGICNGFQILCESGLLPGVLRMNRDLNFHCEEIRLRVERRDTLFTYGCPEFIRLPIAHGEGNYYADKAIIEQLERDNRVLFRYVDELGRATDAANPNGAIGNIAGIINEAGNVCGMMPHPERACDPVLGSTDGRSLFLSIARALQSQCA